MPAAMRSGGLIVVYDERGYYDRTEVEQTRRSYPGRLSAMFLSEVVSWWALLRSLGTPQSGVGAEFWD